MKTLHCPNCGTPFVRVAPQTGMMERVLQQLNVFPFRCQLCMNKFRAFHREAGGRATSPRSSSIQAPPNLH